MSMCEKQALIDFDLMAIKLAKKYSTKIEFEDLYQIAKIAIVEAIRSFDDNRGVKLSTHIFTNILFNIKIFNSKNTSLIYQPNYSNQRFTRIDFESIDFLKSNEDEFSQIDAKVSIDKALSELTDRQKEILYLKYYEGLTTNEIADLLNCTHQNISKINTSAINILQNTFELQ